MPMKPMPTMPMRTMSCTRRVPGTLGVQLDYTLPGHVTTKTRARRKQGFLPSLARAAGSSHVKGSARPVGAVGPDDAIAADSAQETLRPAVGPIGNPHVVGADQAGGRTAVLIDEHGFATVAALTDFTRLIRIAVHVPETG